jgi:F-type H+-transporting ATPase subunit b
VRKLLAVMALALALGLSFAGGTARAQQPEPEHAAMPNAEHPYAPGRQEGARIGGELPPGGEETPQLFPKRLLLQFLNFGVLVFILVKFGGPAMNKALSARHHQLKADLSAAEAARAEAEARLARQEARLARLEQEIAGIQAGVKKEAEAEKARLIALAEDRAKRIKEETSFALDQQVKQAEAELRREVALVSVQLAEQIVRRSLTGADQQRLVDTFVADVGAPAAPAAARSSG